MTYTNMLEKVQDSIISGDAGVAAPLVRPNPRLSASALLGIYIEGYRIRLSQAVRSDYPCLAHYLGEERMNGLVAAYVKKTPSCSYNLDHYPFAFRRFVAQACEDEAAHALAELEGVMAEVFMLPESAPMDFESFGSLDAESLGRMSFALRSAGMLIRLAYDAEAYLQAYKKGEAEKDIQKRPAHLYLYRHDNEVKRQQLEIAEYQVLSALGHGESFSAAIETALASHIYAAAALAEKIRSWLPKWIGQGFFAHTERVKKSV
ncbi:MAG: putative DNA-binding domain-containing protein [Proteobacteria bacterium]|nr:putative DNA-binding domain-containing protein [Pseudomonadota bacterium]